MKCLDAGELPGDALPENERLHQSLRGKVAIPETIFRQVLAVLRDAEHGLLVATKNGFYLKTDNDPDWSGTLRGKILGLLDILEEAKS